MGNYLYSLGLDFLAQDEDSTRGFIGHVLSSGKAITGYYGLPHINQHFGPTQIICRTYHDAESGKLGFAGFDSHADSLCIWKLRIESKLTNPDEEDPTQVKLLVRNMDGDGMLITDVVNGDILPSFKKDEVIELQMIAFSEKADFFEDEEAYEKSIEPGLNGKKTMIAANHIFPVGIFSDDESFKDLVQIRGTVKKAAMGKSVFGDQEIKTNVRFYVDTQFGEIVIIHPLEDLKDRYRGEEIGPGKIINCFARLSGDAAILKYEDGVVRDAENNLRLVAYTLENGDPARLGTALSDSFVYHSEYSGKHFENAEEYLNFVRMVQEDGETTQTEYATIIGVDENPGELEYPVGTRCILLSYKGEDQYNSIVFVDTDEEGKIKRIYLSCESRYRFQPDDPFPETEEDLEELMKNTTFQFAMTGRAHYFSLIDPDYAESEIEVYAEAHHEELAQDVSDLFGREIVKETFEEAFLRGIRKSKVQDYNEDEMRQIGGQFVKDATLGKTEEQQRETFQDALIFASAIGRLYIGKAGASTNE